MMYTALLVAAASLASAQYTYNSTTKVYTCPPDALNGAFCAGETLQTNIIVRCDNGIGQLGNCNDNLAGYFPIGVSYAPCWQTSNTSGDAACSKNCIVEGSSGNYNGTFTLPGCTPSSSSAAASSTTASVSTTSISSASATTTASSSPSGATSTITTTILTTTSCSTSSVGPTGGSTSSSNGTVTSASNSASKTVTGPTTSSSSSTQFTGAANAMSVSSGASLAGIGLLIAYFL